MICLKTIEGVAKHVIEITKRHSPQIMFDSGSKVHIGILQYDSDESKTVVIEEIRKLIKAKNIERYIIIMDAYRGENPNVRPSKDPNKVSCLVINQFTKDGKQDAMIMNTYTKKEDDIIWGERVIVDSNIHLINCIWNVYKEYITVNGLPFNVDGDLYERGLYANSKQVDNHANTN